MSQNGRKTKGTSFFVRVIRRDPCGFCGRVYEKPLTVDHIRPRSEGGTNAWYNFTGACGRCNNRKRSNSLLGHLLGEKIPNGFQILPEPLPERWYDPLNIMPSNEA